MVLRTNYIIRFVAIFIALLTFSQVSLAQRKSKAKAQAVVETKETTNQTPQTTVAVEEKKPMTVSEYISSARELQELGDADKSLSLLNDALEMASFAEEQNTSQIAEILNLQAMSYSMKFEWAKAIKLGESAIRRIGINHNTQQFPEILYSLASYYAGRGSEGDYTKALNYVVKSRDLYDKRSVNYFYCNNNIVYYYMLANDQNMALSLVEDAIKSGEKIYVNDRAAYIKELWKYASMISELGDYRLASYYAIACLKAMEAGEMAHSTDYIRRTIKLAGFYYQRRDFINEIQTLTKIVQVSKEMDGEESTNYVDCLRKLALAYNHQANEVRDKHNKEEYEKCMQQNEFYEELSRDILLRTGNIYEIRTYQIPLISNQAYQLFSEKKYSDAIKYEQVAYTLYNKEGDSLNIARTSNNLANFYYNYNQQLDSALVYSRISVDLYDKIPRNIRNKGLSYHNRAVYSHANGDLPEALQYQIKAVKTFELAGDTLTMNYVNALGNAGVYSQEAGNAQQAKYYGLRSADALELAVAHEKKETLAKISKMRRKDRKAALAALAEKPKVDNKMVVVQWNKAMSAENPKDIHDAYSKAENIQREVFIQNFPGYDVDARRAEWKKRSFVYDYAETLAFSYHSDDSLVTDAFNALLIRDGIEDYIKTCEPSSITKDWKAVAAELDDNTAMVRFFILPTSNRGDAYSAFVLCKGWTVPKVAHQIFTNSDLDMLNYEPHGDFHKLFATEIGRSHIANEGRFGRMIWKSIIATFAPTITSIRYHSSGIGILDSFDPSTYTLEENQQPISKQFKMEKF